MDEPTRIILAVRVGKASEAPGKTAAWLASRLGADLTLVYVASELQTVAEVASGAGLRPDEVRERMTAEARERTREWGRSALGDLTFEVRIEEGEVAERLSAVADEIGAELMVAGTEARGAIQGMIIGDTTREILRRSPCPVVVVPPPRVGRR